MQRCLDLDGCHGGAHVLVGEAAMYTHNDSRAVGAGTDVSTRLLWELLSKSPAMSGRLRRQQQASA